MKIYQIQKPASLNQENYASSARMIQFSPINFLNDTQSDNSISIRDHSQHNPSQFSKCVVKQRDQKKLYTFHNLIPLQSPHYQQPQSPKSSLSDESEKPPSKPLQIKIKQLKKPQSFMQHMPRNQEYNKENKPSNSSHKQNKLASKKYSMTHRVLKSKRKSVCGTQQNNTNVLILQKQLKRFTYKFAEEKVNLQEQMMRLQEKVRKLQSELIIITNKHDQIYTQLNEIKSENRQLRKELAHHQKIQYPSTNQRSEETMAEDDHTSIIHKLCQENKYLTSQNHFLQISLSHLQQESKINKTLIEDFEQSKLFQSSVSSNTQLYSNSQIVRELSEKIEQKNIEIEIYKKSLQYCSKTIRGGSKMIRGGSKVIRGGSKTIRQDAQFVTSNE